MTISDLFILKIESNYSASVNFNTKSLENTSNVFKSRDKYNKDIRINSSINAEDPIIKLNLIHFNLTTIC